jgi:hypothetical protein
MRFRDETIGSCSALVDSNFGGVVVRGEMRCIMKTRPLEPGPPEFKQFSSILPKQVDRLLSPVLIDVYSCKKARASRWRTCKSGC